MDTIEVLKKEIAVSKQALAALELKALDEKGRPVWSRAQADQLSKARIALRAQIDGAEFRIRMIEAAHARPRTRAERERPTTGPDLRSLLAGR